MPIENNHTPLDRSFTTVLKGIAMLMVVFCHIGNQFCRYLTPLGGVGVAIFLMLSGYGLSLSCKKTGLDGYWRKRFITVLVPYAFVEIITLPLRGDVTPVSFLLDIALIQPQFQLGWFMNYILVLYIVFWVSFKIPAPEKKKLGILAVFLVALGVYYLFTSPIRFEQSFSFFIGVVMANWDIRKKLNVKVSAALMIFAIIVLGLKQIEYVRDVSLVLCFCDLLIKTCASVGIVFFLYYVSDRFGFWKQAERVLSPIGGYAFELYLVHGYALMAFDLNYPQAIIAVGVFCFSLLVAWLFHLLNDHVIQKKLKAALLPK